MSNLSRPDPVRQLADWKIFYKNLFGFNLDLSQVKIPKRQPGFDRLLVIAQGLTPDKVFEICQKRFKCWRYTEDLDKATEGRNDREPTQTYTIWVRDRVEADEELKNLSAEELQKQKIPGITLLERLIYELKFWDETAKHLDIQNLTLCSGSRNPGGGVLNVDWSSDRLRVDWYAPQDADPSFRARAVVS